ncbi:MAG: carbohydrate ABC transporter permease, partial [Proteobacteria bacterium]|nr:carbohydrate ABC transporter permease [Pseudomonadota bacterium]
SLNLFPSEPTLSNYIYLFEETSFFTWMKNSFIVSSVVTISVLFFDALIGYTLCKFRFRGRKIIFIAILSTLMIPTEMLVIPWYVLSKNLGLIDSYFGLMFPGLMSGFGVFLMKQFFENVPNDLIDAARIDGVGEFKIFIEIALPLVAPALSALAIFTFLGNWTAFLWPMIVTTSADLYTIPVGLASFSGEFQTEWEMIMTGAAVASLPTLFVFLFLQRYIIRGIILGSLKG